MESYSVQAVLSVTDRGFTGTMNKAVSSLSELDGGSKKTTSSIMKIASGVGVFKALDASIKAVGNSVGSAVERFDTMNRFPKVMEQVGFGAKESGASIQKLADGIEGLPTSLDAITGSTQKLALLTGNLGKATNTSIALNNAFLASGASTADAERGLIQYTQMLSKGTVDMQSWRTLQETMGVGLNELAKAFGFAGATAQQDLYGALQSGAITFDQLNSKLIELDGGVNGFAERAKTASAGIGTSFQNLQTAAVKGVAKVIEATDEMLTDNGFPKLAEIIDNAKGGINASSSVIAGSIKTVGGAVITLGPSLAIGTAGWAAYGASMKISSQIDKVKGSIEASRKAVEQARSASELSAKAEMISANATQARDKAIRMASMAESLDTKAKVASAAASKARTTADKLAKKATEARNAASKAGWMNSALNAKAEATEAAATVAGAKADDLESIAEAKKTKAKTYGLKTSVASATAEAADTAATTANATATTAQNTVLTVKQAILGGLSAKLGIVTVAQTAWNAALTANPIGTVIMATAALVAAMVGVANILSKLDTKSRDMMATQEKAINRSKEFVSSLKETQKSYKDSVSDAEASAKANKELANNIEMLSAKENKSAKDKAELKAYVDSLNASVEGLNIQYNSEKDALNMSAEAIKQKVKAYESEAKAQSAQERYLEVKKEQNKLDKEQTALQEKKNQFEKEWQSLNNDGPASMSKYIESMSSFNEQQKALNSQKQQLSQSEERLKGIMVESQQAQANAVSTGAQSQITSLEQLNDAQRSIVDSLNSTWQSYVDQATNMFDVLSDESELSVAEMTANMQENQRVIGAWADNIAALASRGVDEGLLEKLRQAGPESAGYVNAMVQASDTELQQMSEVFRAGGEMATKALGASIGSAEIPAEIMGFATKTKDTLAQQIAAADFSSIGKDAVDGYTEGIANNASLPATAITGMVTGGVDAAQAAQNSNSPSVVYQGLGKDAIDGYVLGIQGQAGILNSVMQTTMTSAGQMAATSMNNALNNIQISNVSAFAKITSAARSGMSGMVSEVQNGTTRSRAAMQAGMQTMNALVKSGMQTMRSTSTSSMLDFTRAIDTGMTQSNASVSRGNTSMISTLSRLRSGFYDSGYFASLGLANGINAGASVAISAAQRVADRVAEIMKSTLKERSPSRVTRKIGAFASEGLEIGLLDKLRAVESAAERVAEVAVPTGSISNQVAYAGGYIPNTSYEYAGSVSANYTIVVPVVMDGKEIARVTAPYTQEELDKQERRNNRKRGYK